MAGTEWPPQGRFKAIFEQLALEDEQQQQEVVNEAELAELQKALGHAESSEERLALSIAQRQHRAEKEDKQQKDDVLNPPPPPPPEHQQTPVPSVQGSDKDSSKSSHATPTAKRSKAVPHSPSHHSPARSPQALQDHIEGLGIEEAEQQGGITMMEIESDVVLIGAKDADDEAKLAFTHQQQRIDIAKERITLAGEVSGRLGKEVKKEMVEILQATASQPVVEEQVLPFDCFVANV
jgi:hypothetical protein